MTAMEFVRSVDLTGTPMSIMEQDAATDVTAIFDQARPQSQIVGSSILSFSTGVEPGLREAISDCALLAQLVANKQVRDQTKPLDWFAAYFSVLLNLGWILQDGGFTDYSTQGNAVEVNEQIMTVLSVALGAAPAALAIIEATVDALKKMQPDSPWLTLFSRESQKATIARFQVGIANKDETRGAFITLCAFLIEANKSITQVLFFKFKQSHASFKANTAQVSFNQRALVDLSVSIRAKTNRYQHDYVSSILDI